MSAATTNAITLPAHAVTALIGEEKLVVPLGAEAETAAALDGLADYETAVDAGITAIEFADPDQHNTTVTVDAASVKFRLLNGLVVTRAILHPYELDLVISVTVEF